MELLFPFEPLSFPFPVDEKEEKSWSEPSLRKWEFYFVRARSGFTSSMLCAKIRVSLQSLAGFFQHGLGLPKNKLSLIDLFLDVSILPQLLVLIRYSAMMLMSRVRFL